MNSDNSGKSSEHPPTQRNQLWPLFSRIPVPTDQNQESLSADDILDQFLDYIREKRLDLYPAQEEALLELFSGKNVILNTPTGSGKSLVAAGLHFLSLSQNRRSVYTCPIKALVNEKFLALCRDFGPDQVGMVTGDASVNPDAPILCCTAEILANDALRKGGSSQVHGVNHDVIHDIIMDEFHYYSDRERGVAWQIPLLTLPQSRFLLMSATLGDTTFFEKSLTQLNGRDSVTVFSNDRPVPLDFIYSEIPIHEAVAKLISQGRTPIYLVSFTQRGCAEEAQNFMSLDVCTKDEKRAIASALQGFKFSSPYGKELQKFLRHGLGLHHAGLLPKYRILVERLAQQGLLKIIFGTDTLGVGVNVPIRTVVFTKLCKFDGEKTAILSVRDFKQISGRAGRKGFDDLGTVVVQAPEHVIENIKLEQKAAGDPKKLRKLVRRKPPEKGFVPWNQETFDRLVKGQPEPLVSRFQISHSMILLMLERQNEDGCRALQKLIRDCHESPNAKKQLRKKGFQLFRALVDRRIIELNPLRVNVDLQEDFSLNHALSLYLIDAVKLLDPASENYSLDVLTLVESILENPDLILRKQLDRLKTERMSELKMEGMEYEDRIEELEKLEYPKPNREFIYSTFNEFSALHPWVGQDNIRPKSIAREMYENFHSFSEYIREYDLQRGEGILLRYLFDVFKALVQTVPLYAKNEEIESMEVYFGTMVRQVDSSLLDEWERLRNPNWVSTELKEEGHQKNQSKNQEDHGRFPDPLKNRKAFQILLRNEIFRLIRALACRDFEAAMQILEGSSAVTVDWPPLENEGPWSVDRLQKALDEFRASENRRIRTDTPARAQKHFYLDSVSNQGAAQRYLKAQQILIDTAELNDWVLELTVDLEESRKEGRAVLRLDRIGPIS